MRRALAALGVTTLALTGAVAGLAPSQAITGTYSVDDDHWSWSEGVYGLHGFLQDEVTPSTALLLSHQHPDDREGVYEVLDTAMRAATPFSCYHRVIDRLGQRRMRTRQAIGESSWASSTMTWPKVHVRSSAARSAAEA